MYISIDGELQREEDASIAIGSLGFVYGYGLFETIKFENKEIYFLQEHIDRLKEGSKKLHLPIGFREEDIEVICRQVIEANTLNQGALKVLYAKGNKENHLVVSLRENRYKQEAYHRGFKATFTDVKRNPYAILTYIKSNNYMENLIARQQAIENGYDEVLFENVEGSLCEGAISNLFFIKDNTVFTPSVDCGILPGIMRSKVIEIVEALGLPMEIGKFKRKDLWEAEEVFLTNSLMEIMPVREIDHNKLKEKQNAITEKIRRAYIEYLVKK